MTNSPISASTGGSIDYLGMPGQVGFPLPWDVLASAPWIFIVYLAFQAQWPPVAIIALVAFLLPVALLAGRAAPLTRRG